ncbi:MAG: hypothetical protein A2Y74_03780 [Actinobacteria bacterium RBG_13_63_9]|nr:MAG: hypothetical protein A2Y74_03780 [Actinobacteria bacterium RBG_13_63_9]
MRVVVALAAILVTALLAATWTTAWADEEPELVVSPETVKVGLNFSGADVTISGTTPEGGDVVLVVDGPLDSVKMRKKGKVMGLFWMTVEQAEVEDMPAFHIVGSSEPIESLLSKEQQVRLGVSPESSDILDRAQAVDPDDESPLSEEKQTEFVTALRDKYIRDGRYTPWRCYHEAGAAECDTAAPDGGIIQADDGGHWETSISLPSDAPLGDYSVQAHYVRDGQVVMSDAATFNVEKVGAVDALGSMAEDKAPLYGAMSLAIAIVMGLTIGFVFPRRGGH